MSLNIMKFLIPVVILPLLVGGTRGLSDESVFDFERIALEGGRVYREVLVIEGDRHGLLFRHRDGIAKVPYSELSTNLRMLYEPVGDLPSAEDAEEEEIGGFEEAGKGDDAGGDSGAYVITAQARNRVSVPLSWIGSGPVVPWALPLGYLPEYRAPWRAHWGPYPLALSLANPRYRELAVRDFLQTVYPGVYPCRSHSYRVPLRTYYSRY